MFMFFICSPAFRNQIVILSWFSYFIILASILLYLTILVCLQKVHLSMEKKSDQSVGMGMWRLVFKRVNLLYSETLFPRSPCISHQQQQQQQLWAKQCREAYSMRVLRPLLHKQPRMGTTCPSTWHVSLFFFFLSLFFVTVSLCVSLHTFPTQSALPAYF